MKFATLSLLVASSSAITIRQLKHSHTACDATQTAAGKVNDTAGNCVVAHAACTDAQKTAGKENGTDGNCVLAATACDATQTAAGKVNDTAGNCVVAAAACTAAQKTAGKKDDKVETALPPPPHALLPKRT